MADESIPTALLQHLDQGVLVFDARGQFLFANAAAGTALGAERVRSGPAELRAEAVRRGAREVPLGGNGQTGGIALVLPVDAAARTLAEQERTAILQALEVTHGRLAETARRLGISRTTLWRRLRAYGLPQERAP